MKNFANRPACDPKGAGWPSKTGNSSGGGRGNFLRNKITWIYRLKKHPIVIPKWSINRVLLLNYL